MSDNCFTCSRSIERAMSNPPVFGLTSEDDAVSDTQRRRSNRRRRFDRPSNFVVLALCFVVVASSWSTTTTQAFAPTTRPLRISGTTPTSSPQQCNNNRQGQKSGFHNNMSSLAEPPTSRSSFQKRMKGLVKRGRGGAGRRAIGQRAEDRPANLKMVNTLEEYKRALDDAGEKIVVARFFATWCKACKAIQPAYHRMATLYPDTVFLEVPVTNENADLHQGLEVPSLPYGHIYHPDAGLVEELKISRKYFKNLVRLVRWYDKGECSLDEAPEVQDAA